MSVRASNPGFEKESKKDTYSFMKGLKTANGKHRDRLIDFLCRTDPVTGKLLTSAELVPNVNLRNAIQAITALCRQCNSKAPHVDSISESDFHYDSD